MQLSQHKPLHSNDKTTRLLHPTRQYQPKYQPSTNHHSGSDNLAMQHQVQAKLTISQPGDPYEREADQVADQIMRMPADTTPSNSIGASSVSVQRQCKSCNTKPNTHLQKRQHDTAATNSHQSVTTAIRNGAPLNKPTKDFFESRFGHDFSNVRIHNDNQAANFASDIQARAFTLGDHVAFAAGQYNPQTSTGKRLIAHELTHVVQQRHGRARGIQRDPDPPQNIEPATTTGAAGALSLEAMNRSAMRSGIKAAGPNAVGIVTFPRWSRQAPFAIFENLVSIWGHTAIYVRIDNEIRFVRGLNIDSLVETARVGVNATRDATGKASQGVPSAITDDVSLLKQLNANTLEYPVERALAEKVSQSLPETGRQVTGTPEHWTGRPAKVGNPCKSSNCVLWAIRQLENALGGTVGPSGQGSIADTHITRGGDFRAVPNEGSQGNLIRFLKNITSNNTDLSQPPLATGPGVVSTPTRLDHAKRWGARGLLALAPALEFWMSRREGKGYVQSSARSGTALLSALAEAQLYGGGNALGMKAGRPAAGGVDLAVNLINMAVQLGGGPKELGYLTQTGADLTPSATIMSGAKSFVDTGFAIAEGGNALDTLHNQQTRGSHGGVVQGYALLGDALAGNNLDWTTSDAAARGDNGALLMAGNYWGDVLSGQTSVGSDLKEIWNFMWD